VAFGVRFLHSWAHEGPVAKEPESVANVTDNQCPKRKICRKRHGRCSRSHTFYFEDTKLMLAQTFTERVVQPGTRPKPRPTPPRGCPSNSLGPVWANMYSDPLLSHDTRCRRYQESRPREVERLFFVKSFMFVRCQNYFHIIYFYV